MDDAELAARLREWSDRGVWATEEAAALARALCAGADSPADDALSEFPDDLLQAVREKARSSDPAVHAAAERLLRGVAVLREINERDRAYRTGAEEGV